ncbi:hypothetical protein LSH36_41g11009 [Paralvinella palmiformis]|uniref:Calponin-homology (CH) domain-containing protein n=1 Tax=Paralvinella palmiformis TaxID=53620 RepID=A0AAD9K7Y3_9ANNE|nr:hypothetical protein LSH36_41g11009 [Paralvinella palmiformis]
MSEPPRVISVDGTSQILRKAFFPRWYGLLDTNVAQPAQASSAHSPNTWSAHFDGIRSSVRNKSRQAVEHSSNVLLVADAALACCLYTEMQYSASADISKMRDPSLQQQQHMSTITSNHVIEFYLHYLVDKMANYKAKKAGMALHNQKKLEQASTLFRDCASISTNFGYCSLDDTANINSGPSWRRLHFYMRDGTAICKMVNKVREAAGMSPVKYQKNATTSFVARENIDVFNKAAGELGIDHELLFQNGDLYDGNKGPFLKVVTCLNKLGLLANEKGVSPKYEEVQVEVLDGEAFSST